MQQTVTGGTASKCEAGIQQLVSTLSTLGSKHWVVIDSVSCKPIELESPAALLEFRQRRRSQFLGRRAGDVASRVRLPQANRAGQTDVWICSDHARQRLERNQRPLAVAA